MRIGFDAKRAFLNSSGLGNYSRTILFSLLKNFPGHQYTAFTTGINPQLGADLLANNKLKIILPPEIMRGMFSFLWRSSLIGESISEHNIDVYHGLSNELPKRMPRSTKKIVTIHDLIFLRHPEWYPFIDRNIYYRKFRFACKSADAVIAVSDQTKKDIQYYFNTPEEKIRVIYQSCGESFSNIKSKAELKTFREKNHLPEKFILYVGTIEERKNLLVLVKALSLVQDIPLVVIGRKKKYFRRVNELISSSGLEKRVLFPESILHEELPLFYQSASMLVYPSFYEGFGIPVIEALNAGLPVIAAGAASLPEAGGPASVYFDPANDEELAEKIKNVLEDGDLRNRMISEGKTYVQKFSQSETSNQLMTLYKTISGND